LVAVALRQLRRAGVKVQMHAGGLDGQGSMKSQFKKADASGARYALVFGQDETAQGMVAVKPLRIGADGQPQSQRLCALSDLASWSTDLTH
jgi:histidyl-tRNA synthetase